VHSTTSRVEEEGETIQKWGLDPHPLKLTLTTIIDELDYRVIMLALPRLLDLLGPIREPSPLQRVYSQSTATKAKSA